MLDDDAGGDTATPPGLRHEARAVAANRRWPRSPSVVVPASDLAPGTALEVFTLRLEDALARSPRELSLDLTSVDRVSSTTVALLLWARRRCASQGVTVVVRHPSRRCREILERTGLIRLGTPGHRSYAVQAGPGQK